MLIPVSVPHHQRIWVDVTFRYEKYIYGDAEAEVSKYLLKYARVKNTYTDEEMVRRIVLKMQEERRIRSQQQPPQ